MALFDAEFIEGFVKTKTSKSQRLLAEKQLFFREYSKFSDFGLNGSGQFWLIFMAEFREPRKMGNTYQILLKITLFDTKFIEGFVKTKRTEKQRVLAENQHFSREYLKFSDFGQNGKGQFWLIYMAEIWKLRKEGNPYQILLKMVLFDAKFIEGFVKSKTSKNQRLLAEKWHFSRKYSKFRDFGLNAMGQFWPIFTAELWKDRKIRNTYRILLKMVLFGAEFIEGFVNPFPSKGFPIDE